MKRILVLTGLIAGLCGCSSAPQITNMDKVKKTSVTPLLLHVPYASLDDAAQRANIVEELRAVGKALKRYKAEHDGQLPPTLTTLVTKKYLPAAALISCADPTGGKEGGVPNSYADWGQAAETDEIGSSYLFEFSSVACNWEWKSYLAGKPTLSDLDTGKDGAVSWAEVKSWQLAHGDTSQQPKAKAYPKDHFPVVRCYWYQYPAAYTPDATSRTVLSLSADLETIFISQPWWEKDTGE